eukprot:gene17739-22433_t
MKLLLTGASGQLGHVLAARLCNIGDIIAPTHSQMDLTDADAIRRVVVATQPGLIINAAAYTAVDQAESEPELALRVNGEAAGEAARAAAALGVPMIQISTDYVFDGTLGRPYREDDPVGPISAYGASKLAGEQAVAAATENHAILRTAWVYSPFGKNF